MQQQQQQQQEFTKCQGAPLLKCLSAAARASLRHFEVAAVLTPFSGRLPLHPDLRVPKSFVWVAVTDWAVLVVSLQRPDVLLELPLTLACHMVRWQLGEGARCWCPHMRTTLTGASGPHTALHAGHGACD
jgi:hypothetical protein